VLRSFPARPGFAVSGAAFRVAPFAVRVSSPASRPRVPPPAGSGRRRAAVAARSEAADCTSLAVWVKVASGSRTLDTTRPRQAGAVRIMRHGRVTLH
jgi:hypothetical protein